MRKNIRDAAARERPAPLRPRRSSSWEGDSCEAEASRLSSEARSRLASCASDPRRERKRLSRRAAADSEAGSGAGWAAAPPDMREKHAEHRIDFNQRNSRRST